MMKYSYQSDWCGYTYPETNQISTADDIISEFGFTDISKGRFHKSGIPLYMKNDYAVVNNETESTLIFGETGSKKTRCIIAPLIALAAGAGESAFVTDVKGELSTNPKLQNYLKSKGIKTVFLDFRTFKGDGYNILEPAFDLYCKDEHDKAMNMVTRLVSSLSKRQQSSTADPFWELSARQYLIPLIALLFDFCYLNKEYRDMVNMCSISSFADYSAAILIQKLIQVDCIEPTDSPNLFNMLKTVVNNPEKTLSCIMSTVQSIIHECTMQTDLMNMLSCTTFNLDEMYNKPTFVFLIVPDETDAYDNIAGILIDTFYNRLIEVYSTKYQNKKESPCRINYICDEFCNLNINDMKSKISASRSRNMRWFLVCQSKNQLDTTYPDSSGTIIGNCKSTIFLQSSDMDMLSYISNLCGTTNVSIGGGAESLVTPDMLKMLKKDRDFKEALFIRENLKYFATLPDIDTFDFLKPFASKKPFRFENKCPKKIKALTPSMYYDWCFKENEDKKDNDDDWN